VPLTASTPTFTRRPLATAGALIAAAATATVLALAPSGEEPGAARTTPAPAVARWHDLEANKGRTMRALTIAPAPVRPDAVAAGYPGRR
jgi:hypothetical protein